MRAEQVVIQPEDRDWLTRLGLVGVAEVMAYSRDGRAQPDESFILDVDAGLDGPRRIRVRRRRCTRDSSVVFGLIRGVPWRESDTRQEFELLGEMNRRGIPAERPIAYGEQRSCGLFNEGFVITEVPSYGESPDSAAMRLCSARGIAEIDRSRFLTALGAAVGRMHHGGVQHGALWASNVLVSETSEGEWRFVFIRPGRRGRSFDGGVPRGGAVADLAELAASGAGFGRLRDVARFMKAYHSATEITQRSQRVGREVLAAARGRSCTEGHGLALHEAIECVLRRVEAGASGSTKPAERTFDSVDAFVRAIVSAELPATHAVDGVERIAMVFRDRGEPDRTRRFNVTIAGNGIIVDTDNERQADLLIESDDDAWLAIINAAAVAPQMIRDHRVRLHGNVERLRSLRALLDSIQRSPSSAHGSDATD